MKLNIGSVGHEEAAVKLTEGKASLMIRSDSQVYTFYVKTEKEEICLGRGISKYLSSEVSGGFTGVVLRLYAQGGNTVGFKKISLRYIKGSEI